MYMLPVLVPQTAAAASNLILLAFVRYFRFVALRSFVNFLYFSQLFLGP